MASNPFDLGGAFAGGYQSGATVGASLGNRWNEMRMNSNAKKLAKAEKELVDAGIIDEATGELVDNKALDVQPEFKQAIQTREDLRNKLKQRVLKTAAHGQDADALLEVALRRFDPYGPAPTKAPYADAESTDMEGKPFKEGDNAISFSGSPDPVRSERLIAQRRGRIMDTDTAAKMEEVGRKAAPLIYGQIEPYLRKVQEGTATDSDIQHIGSGLQALTIYNPAWRGSTVQYSPKDKSFFIPTPGGGDTGELIPLAKIPMVKEDFINIALGPSGALERGYNLELKNDAEQKARDAEANKAMVDLGKLLIPVLGSEGATATALATLSRTQGAGWKYEPVDPEVADSFKKVGIENVVSVQPPNGPKYFTGVNPKASAGGTDAPTNVWYDIQGNRVDDATIQKVFGGESENVSSVLSAIAKNKDANVGAIFSLMNTLSGAISTGRPAQFDYKPNDAPSAIAPRGGAPHAGFPSDTSKNIGARNNNPGNIKDPKTGEFRKFNTPEEGLAAMKHQLSLYASGQSKAAGLRKLNTIADILSVYAPASDNNDLGSYAKVVSEALGVAPNTPLNLADPAQLDALALAMAKHETGYEPGTPSLSVKPNPTLKVQAPTVAALPPRKATSPREQELLGQQRIKGQPTAMADGGTVTIPPALLDFLRG